MLNRSKLLKELQNISETLFVDYSDEYECAQKIWEIIVNDPTFIYKVRTANVPWLLPTWSDKLGDAIPVSTTIDSYRAVSIDGSQIYPDRHQGPPCFLINVGTVSLKYGSPGKSAEFNSIPYVFMNNSEADEDINDNSIDMVNCKRQELEFLAGLEMSLQLQNMSSNPSTSSGRTVLDNYSSPPDHPECPPKADVSKGNSIILFDGSLVFWHLESKEATIRETFLRRYCAALHHLYKTGTPMACYISLPKNKELVNLIRLHLSEGALKSSTDDRILRQASESSHKASTDRQEDLFGAPSAIAEGDGWKPVESIRTESNEVHKKVDHVLDTAIANFFLKPYERSIVFQNHATICKLYPEHLQPHFFYLHVGTEIGRVEIPAWIASDKIKVDLVAQMVLDQCIKGNGYPVVIAEAHEQAVVKGPDREFFYHLIRKFGFDQKQRPVYSQKSMKKRSIGI